MKESISAVKLIKFTNIVLSLSLLTSCCAIIPEKSETFVSEMDLLNLKNFENSNELSKYYVGRSLIDMSIESRDDRPPYYLYMSVDDSKDKATKIKIHNLIIKINNKKVANFLLSSSTDYSLKIPPVFPIEIIDDPMKSGISFTTRDIDMEFSKKSYVVVELDIEVFYADANYRGIVKYNLYPRVEWQGLQCLSV